jgi:hypothetical protein
VFEFTTKVLPAVFTDHVQAIVIVAPPVTVKLAGAAIDIGNLLKELLKNLVELITVFKITFSARTTNV